MRSIEDDAIVDFIADDPEVVLSCKGKQLVALLDVERATGRVAREVVQNGDRAFVDKRFQVAHLRNEFMLELAWVVGG